MNMNSSINPGRLRERLRLEKRDHIPDGLGGFTDNFQLVALLWANIKSKTSLVSDYAGNLDARNSHAITIRWRDDCHPEMRFLKGQREFQINSVRDPQENQRYLICKCEEII